MPEVFHHRHFTSYGLFFLYIVIGGMFVQLALPVAFTPEGILLMVIVVGLGALFGLIIKNVRVEIDGTRVRQYNLFNKVVLDDDLSKASNIGGGHSEYEGGPVSATFPSGKLSISQQVPQRKRLYDLLSGAASN